MQTFGLRAPCGTNINSRAAVAIYHLSVKTVSRSAGRTATAAAAYRAGVEITDEQTGEVHDYTRKGGVMSADLVLPEGAPEWATDRGALWNAAEKSETRKNSTVAREFEVALPSELNADERRRLALDFAAELAERHRCAVDVAIHAPGREGDNRNHHAHILCTTRRLTPEGFADKTRELDDRKTREVDRWRERWAEVTNTALERAGHAERIDHRSHAARGLAPELAGVHLGPTASAIERRGEASERGERNRVIQDAGRAAGQLGQEAKAVQVEQAAALRAQAEAERSTPKPKPTPAPRRPLDLSGLEGWDKPIQRPQPAPPLPEPVKAPEIAAKKDEAALLAERTTALHDTFREYMRAALILKGAKEGPALDAVMAEAEKRIAAMVYTPEAMEKAKKALEGVKALAQRDKDQDQDRGR